MPISLTPGSLARLLGAVERWRRSGLPRTGRRRPPAHPRRPHRPGRRPAERAFAGRNPWHQPHDGDRGLRPAARAGLPQQRPGQPEPQLHPEPGAGARRERRWRPDVERRSRAGRARRDPGPGLRFPARQRRSGAPGVCRGTDGAAGAAAGLRLRRPGRRPAPRSHRRAVHRGRGTHDGGPDPGHLGRSACPEHCAPHPGRPIGHQGARRAPQLPQCPRRDPGSGLPAGPGGHARRGPPRRWRPRCWPPRRWRLGLRGHGSGTPAAAARDGLRGAGLPQPHRAADARCASGAAS